MSPEGTGLIQWNPVRHLLQEGVGSILHSDNKVSSTTAILRPSCKFDGQAQSVKIRRHWFLKISHGLMAEKVHAQPDTQIGSPEKIRCQLGWEKMKGGKGKVKHYQKYDRNSNEK